MIENLTFIIKSQLHDTHTTYHNSITIIKLKELKIDIHLNLYLNRVCACISCFGNDYNIDISIS